MGSKSDIQLMESYRTHKRNEVLCNGNRNVSLFPKWFAWNKKGNALGIVSKSISKFYKQNNPKGSDGVFLILKPDIMSTRRNYNQLIEDLKRFTGSPVVFKVPLLHTQYTEGIRYLAQKAHSYWMITDISLIAKKLMKKSYFVCIEFKRLAKEKQQCLGYEAEITYSDGNGKVFLTQPYEHADFLLDSLRLFFIDNILLLRMNIEGLSFVHKKTAIK